MERIKKYVSGGKLSLFVALVVMWVIFSMLSPYFFTTQNSINILVAASLMGLVAIGETYLLIGGLVDLSPGSTAALSSVIVAILLRSGLNMGLAIIISIIIGIFIGMINGIIVNKLEIEPFIATLASMTIVRGAAFIFSGGKPIFVSNKNFILLGKTRVLGIPIPVLILIAVFIIFGIILGRTSFGRNIYVIGGNKKASFLAGLNPQKMTLILYMIMGGLSALGGIILTSRLTSGQPAANIGLEFDAITAAVLGGTAFTGGVGTIFGTFLGVLILQGFNNGLLILNVPSFWQYVARGLLLLIALAFDYIRRQRRKK
ncbi:MAG: ABC transporter permease [Psychrilyobacter sp.]|uniref:ABC transporter permease n=1 Tax=Psychrilyobacter sp. TaxID=2586924 RepID=UPI003C7270CB